MSWQRWQVSNLKEALTNILFFNEWRSKEIGLENYPGAAYYTNSWMTYRHWLPNDSPPYLSASVEPEDVVALIEWLNGRELVDVDWGREAMFFVDGEEFFRLPLHRAYYASQTTPPATSRSIGYLHTEKLRPVIEAATKISGQDAESFGVVALTIADKDVQASVWACGKQGLAEHEGWTKVGDAVPPVLPWCVEILPFPIPLTAGPVLELRAEYRAWGPVLEMRTSRFSLSTRSYRAPGGFPWRRWMVEGVLPDCAGVLVWVSNPGQFGLGIWGDALYIPSTQQSVGDGFYTVPSYQKVGNKTYLVPVQQILDNNLDALRESVQHTMSSWGVSRLRDMGYPPENRVTIEWKGDAVRWDHPLKNEKEVYNLVADIIKGWLWYFAEEWLTQRFGAPHY